MQQVGAGVSDPERDQWERADGHRDRQAAAARKALATRALRRMYAAQKPPATSASTTPVRSGVPTPPSSSTPAAASPAHNTSSRVARPGERDAERPDELERDGDSEVDAVERLVEAQVHERQT